MEDQLVVVPSCKYLNLERVTEVGRNDARDASMRDTVELLSSKQGQLLQLQVETAHYQKAYVDERIGSATQEARSHAEALGQAVTKVYADQIVMKEHLGAHLSAVDDHMRTQFEIMHQDISARQFKTLETFDRRLSELDCTEQNLKTFITTQEEALAGVQRGLHSRVDDLEGTATVAIQKLESQVTSLSVQERRVSERVDSVEAVCEALRVSTDKELADIRTRLAVAVKQPPARMSPVWEDTKKALAKRMDGFESETKAQIATAEARLVDLVRSPGALPALQELAKRVDMCEHTLSTLPKTTQSAPVDPGPHRAVLQALERRVIAQDGEIAELRTSVMAAAVSESRLTAKIEELSAALQILSNAPSSIDERVEEYFRRQSSVPDNPAPAGSKVSQSTVSMNTSEYGTGNIISLHQEGWIPLGTDAKWVSSIQQLRQPALTAQVPKLVAHSEWDKTLQLQQRDVASLHTQPAVGVATRSAGARASAQRAGEQVASNTLGEKMDPRIVLGPAHQDVKILPMSNAIMQASVAPVVFEQQDVSEEPDGEDWDPRIILGPRHRSMGRQAPIAAHGMVTRAGAAQARNQETRAQAARTAGEAPVDEDHDPRIILGPKHIRTAVALDGHEGRAQAIHVADEIRDPQILVETTRTLAQVRKLAQQDVAQRAEDRIRTRRGLSGHVPERASSRGSKSKALPGSKLAKAREAAQAKVSKASRDRGKVLTNQ